MKNLGLSFLLLISFSCKKNQLGGKSVIEGDVIHHTKKIPNASVFIKFGAKESPGTDTLRYDSKVVADAEGHYSFKTYKGDYYIYAVGKDYGIAPPYTVGGGVPVSIRNNETVNANVAVTEL